MGKIKPYKEQDSPKQTAQEPMMATYHQSAIPMDDFINSIPPRCFWLKPFYLP